MSFLFICSTNHPSGDQPIIIATKPFNSSVSLTCSVNCSSNQLGTITTPEPRTINIQVWDLNNVPLIDSSLKKSELGLNPQIDGQLIRLPIPDLSEERRMEMKKIVKSMGEKCKVSIRNIRRDCNDELKKLLKLKEISEDNEKKFEKVIQEYTDQNIKLIDDKVLSKEKEIMTI